eukprot:COSAG02_NODE_2183_length_9581_cov_22.013394_10_plen_182_part_00
MHALSRCLAGSLFPTLNEKVRVTKLVSPAYFSLGAVDPVQSRQLPVGRRWLVSSSRATLGGMEGWCRPARESPCPRPRSRGRGRRRGRSSSSGSSSSSSSSRHRRSRSRSRSRRRSHGRRRSHDHTRSRGRSRSRDSSHGRSWRRSGSEFSDSVHFMQFQTEFQYDPAQDRRAVNEHRTEH